MDIDLLENGSKKIVLLCHGLEGSSESKYIRAAAFLLSANGYAIAAMNYRAFAVIEINRQLITYHSGRTEDLHAVISMLLPKYEAIYLVGFNGEKPRLKVQQRVFSPLIQKSKLA